MVGDIRVNNLISGTPQVIYGVGTICSPKLKDILCQEDGNNYHKYVMLSNIVSSDFNDLITLFEKMGFEEELKVDIPASYNKFDFLTRTSLNVRAYFLNALSLVFKETVVYLDVEKSLAFLVEEESPEIVGSVNRDNYSELEELIRQVLYIRGINKSIDKKVEQELSPQQKALENMFQQYESSMPSFNPEHKDYELDNIISKVCAAGIGYTLFNIYDLTVYQLYDQFSSLIQMKAWEIEKSIYAFNGGDSFKPLSWLKNTN